MIPVLSAGFWQSALGVIAPKAWALAKILILFFVVRFALYRLTSRAIAAVSRESERAPRLRTLAGLVRSIAFYVLIFIVGVMALRVFEVDPTPVLTAAGVVGLAVGFGAQRLVRDVISGFFIVLENQYSVGEYVTIGAHTGTVVELGMRTTRLRDDAGALVMISNGDITLVINQSRGAVLATLEICVPANADLDAARRAIDAAGAEVAGMQGVVTPPRADGISALSAAGMTIRVTGEALPGRQDAVAQAMREAVRARLSEAGIPLA
ncbi:MAG: mechanosensitive ion channel family protein [Armatimonadota bacterium]